ncbi:hypothetical protein [Pseudanabaena sp. FACHB-2040]|uniref:ArnT family glycosyltransferase n=1 Tax=Pseudanabaena sp. FACHB-2040 TaxID=2692859 RepID=UPI001683EBA1|nr:hypothetical protein [Pseudanabaena sp. FACHB-2040]MBD2260582.1 hypothetical protein [Pseudanabaena sp. FACHB-2040]
MIENQSLLKVKPAFLFLLLVAFTYTVLFFAMDQLRGPFWIDEAWFWETSQQFSQSLIPTLDQLRNYNELNTPLPFILYGMLEYLFDDGLFAGRLLNFLLSIAIVFLIGWPGQGKRFKPILAVLGLFLFPYFLWLSARFYTDLIASIFALLGVVFYLRKQPIVSGLVFILAIASRQYMVAFPVAIAAHELVIAIRYRQRPSLSFFLPFFAALSLLGWFVLFGGLAPQNALASRPAPDVQYSFWALLPSSSIFFLSSIGLSFVIPEFLLLYRRLDWSAVFSKKSLLIAGGLLLLFIIFPPPESAKGLVWRVAEAPDGVLFIPRLTIQRGVYYGLALLTCLRFSNLGLGGWMVLFNALIMLKAFPWDRYSLPLIIVLWYLQSKNQLDHPLARSPVPAPERVEEAPPPAKTGIA